MDGIPIRRVGQTNNRKGILQPENRPRGGLFYFVGILKRLELSGTIKFNENGGI